jgi:hypothetical protein
MAAIDWDTVRTSVASAAATALLVTLAVEYFAKPRLEVRKERMLDMVRARKELISSIVGISLAAQMLVQPLPDDIDPAVRDTFQAEQERHYARLRETSVGLFDNAGKYVGAYPTVRIQTFVMDYVTTLYGVVVSSRTRRRQAEIIIMLTKSFTTAIDPGRWWRVPSGALAMMEAERLMAGVREPAADPRPSAV